MLKKCLPEIKERFCNIHSGFFIVSLIVSFNHPTHGGMLLDLQNTTRVCLTIAENEVYQPVKITIKMAIFSSVPNSDQSDKMLQAFKPKPDYCEGWYCWQSQLKLENKMRISRIMNNLRNNLATDIINMHQLVSNHSTARIRRKKHQI